MISPFRAESSNYNSRCFRQTITLVITIFFFGIIGHGQNDTKITTWQTILQISIFQKVSNPKKIDKGLLSKFPNWKKMSPQGARFNSSDIGGGPHRRVYFIANSGNYWIVSYEHGGKVYHSHCFLITLDAENTSILDNNCLKFESFDLLKQFWESEICPFAGWAGDY
jgi:hypothetical protein